KKHVAFHPFGSQQVYDIGPDFFCILRSDPDETEKVLVLCNVTNSARQIEIKETELPVDSSKTYSDVISGQERIRNGKATLLPFDVLWIVL
ncbi:MAG: hypothetical protein ACFCU6_10410, partial [Balneolaceae bacterium]